MSTNEDQHYWARRADQERRAAARAIRPEIRGLHLDLASRYAEQLSALERDRPVNLAPVRPASA